MKHLFSLLFILVFCLNTHAQETPRPYTLEELQSQLTHEKYTEKILLDFQKSMGQPEIKPEVYEYIPGEVLAWSIIYRRFAIHKVYLVQKDSLRPVEAKPSDTTFLKKLNSYVPKKSRFTYSSDLWTFPFVKEKRDDGSYLIKASVKSYNRQPDFPNPDILMYNLEYTTTDFQNFTLVRLKDNHAEEWIEVGAY
jgi:hypothetical protein